MSSKAPAQILQVAKRATSSAKSVHIAGSGQAQGQTFDLDLTLNANNRATGFVTLSGSRIQLRRVGSEVFIQGDRGFWQKLGGTATANLLTGRWLKAPVDNPDFASLGQLTDLGGLVSELLSGTPSGLHKGRTATVLGQSVIAVSGVSSQSSGTAYVATTGSPRLVQITSQGTSIAPGAGRIDFTGYGHSFQVRAPRNAVDITQLQGGQTSTGSGSGSTSTSAVAAATGG